MPKLVKKPQGGYFFSRWKGQAMGTIGKAYCALLTVQCIFAGWNIIGSMAFRGGMVSPLSMTLIRQMGASLLLMCLSLHQKTFRAPERSDMPTAFAFGVVGGLWYAPDLTAPPRDVLTSCLQHAAMLQYRAVGTCAISAQPLHLTPTLVPQMTTPGLAAIYDGPLMPVVTSVVTVLCGIELLPVDRRNRAVQFFSILTSSIGASMIVVATGDAITDGGHPSASHSSSTTYALGNGLLFVECLSMVWGYPSFAAPRTLAGGQCSGSVTDTTQTHLHLPAARCACCRLGCWCCRSRC